MAGVAARRRRRKWCVLERLQRRDRANLPRRPGRHARVIVYAAPQVRGLTTTTTVATDSPLLAASIDGKEHLEIRSALETIGEVLTRHLVGGAFDD